MTVTLTREQRAVLAELPADERRALRRHTDFIADPAGALALVADGFRLSPANTLREGDVVACRETWFGLTAGPVKHRTVVDVAPEVPNGDCWCLDDEPHCCVLIVELAGDAPAEVDGEALVWRKAAA